MHTFILPFEAVFKRGRGRSDIVRTRSVTLKFPSGRSTRYNSEERILRGMIISSCPAEGDPVPKVHDFVAKNDVPSIAGFRLDGLEYLKNLVVDEIKAQEPESRIIDLDRDYVSDNGIDFLRDLRKNLEKVTAEGGRVNWIVFQDVPVMDWQAALDVLKGKDAQVYFFTSACRQVPCCFKLLL